MRAYGECSDEELIGRLRGGELPIMDYILAKYKPVVRKKANAMYLIGGETEDLIQEGMIGLFKAIRDFREDKESSFFTFAGLCISRQLYSAARASNRKKHVPLNTYVSFDASAGEDGKPLSETLTADIMENPEQIVIAQENIRVFFEDLKRCLSVFEIEVLNEYLTGENYRQIAEKMGKSPKTIDNALSRIKIKIKEMGKNGRFDEKSIEIPSK